MITMDIMKALRGLTIIYADEDTVLVGDQEGLLHFLENPKLKAINLDSGGVVIKTMDHVTHDGQIVYESRFLPANTYLLKTEPPKSIKVVYDPIGRQWFASP